MKESPNREKKLNKEIEIKVGRSKISTQQTQTNVYHITLYEMPSPYELVPECFCYAFHESHILDHIKKLE